MLALVFAAVEKPYSQKYKYIVPVEAMTNKTVYAKVSAHDWSDESYDSWGKDPLEARQMLKLHLCRGCARSCTLRSQEEKDRSMTIHVDM